MTLQICMTKVNNSMAPLNIDNLGMVMEIMNKGGHDSTHESTKQYTKYSNSQFEIIVKNNSSIVVIDKRLPVKVYSDLRTAYMQIKAG